MSYHEEGVGGGLFVIVNIVWVSWNEGEGGWNSHGGARAFGVGQICYGTWVIIWLRLGETRS